MEDEKFVFFQEVKEKNTTARSSHNRRPHAGKGGGVKFPSDYLSKKELQAMNGETKTYRMNAPMTWKEFKAMPDDLKIMYITALRQKYSVPDSKIAEMLGTSKDGVSLMFKKLQINGEKTRKYKNWDSEGWFAWVNGTTAKEDKAAVEQPEPIPQIAEKTEDQTEDVNIAPCSGRMTFVGTADAALKMVSRILGGASVKITVSWESAAEGVSAHD